MYQITTQHRIDLPWTEIIPLRVGSVPPGLGTPDWYVLIEKSNYPWLRIDVYENTDEANVFMDTLLWRDLIVLGFGHRVYFYPLDTQRLKLVRLDSYFSSFHSTDVTLLVASASSIYRIDHHGEIVWQTDAVAVDGIIIRNIAKGVIVGEGEWDPPGGWRPFQVDLHTGKIL